MSFFKCSQKACRFKKTSGESFDQKGMLCAKWIIITFTPFWKELLGGGKIRKMWRGWNTRASARYLGTHKKRKGGLCHYRSETDSLLAQQPRSDVNWLCDRAQYSVLPVCHRLLINSLCWNNLRWMEKLQSYYRKVPCTFQPISPGMNIFHNDGNWSKWRDEHWHFAIN